ncbi:MULTISPECIES: sugar phosphate isomerase/epimerase [unclassified Paenibacillus]|uniref:sugar phosphate isomerase/epimerase family protein n=1 Tax=unclassified Paenibacillus TaxID=185978 RepID=UPI001C106159|nr:MULTISPECIES: sugar phosphate isomerase/epimerase family protein [unclassified Paenibacillus]MBU5442933.1 sugar phosphate isomerase/epimerase [Paenibacillus sp. MSJ-34]CAH0119519.1 Inosose dehydratase [Paenibacillus sp. CECT 9249]
MKLGVSSYSLQGAAEREGMTILDMIRWTAELGGEHVEIVPIGFDLVERPELAAQIRQTAEEAGIELSNYAIGANFMKGTETEYAAEIERVMKHVDAARQLGVTRMRHDAAWRPTDEISVDDFERDFEALVRACRTVAEYAGQFGIVTSVENHGYYIQASERVGRLVRAVDREHFRTTLDVGNFLCVDENPSIAVRNNIPLASMVHVKDSRNPGEGWFKTAYGNYLRGAIAGHGDIDMYEIIRIVKRSGYDGYISIEFEGMEECKSAIKIGMENIRRIWDEV